MDVEGVTNRLAVTEIDFEQHKLHTLFKVFESVVGDAVVKVSLFQPDASACYAIVEFRDRKSAKEAYDALDGVEIENSGSTLNLSFVPDEFEHDALVDECSCADNYEEMLERDRGVEINEDMIELSDELNIDFGIPEGFKTVENVPEEKEADESSDHEISKALKQKKAPAEHDETFEFDVKDSRFASLFENDDFVIDASNRKSKQQRATKLIVEERQRRKAGTD